MSNSSRFTSVTAELQSNQRLRLGVWAMLGILGFYGVLHLQDAVNDQKAKFVSESKKIDREEAIASQSQWESRLETARIISKPLESRLWREKTKGLAQASFQDWLNQVAKQVGLSRPQINVSVQDSVQTSSSETIPDLWQTQAKLTFDFDPKSFADFLGKLAGHDKIVVIQNLSVRSTPTPRVNIVLVGYFSKVKESE